MSYGGDAYGTLAYGEGAGEAAAAPPPPYNLVMVVADTAHAATTHTRHMLEMAGHTVTVVLDTTTADLTAYDVILIVRGSAPAAVITAWDAGVPVVFGSGTGLTAGSGQSMPSTTHNLTGTWSATSSADKRYQIEVTDASHYIASPLGLGARYLYGLDSWRFGLDAAAAYVGTALVEGDPADATAGGITLIAVEQGTERLNAAGPTPARAVVFGDLYAGQDVYDAFGYQLLERSLHWCLGHEAPVSSVPVVESWSVTGTPAVGGGNSSVSGSRFTADAAMKIGHLRVYPRLASTVYTISIWDNLNKRVTSRSFLSGAAYAWVEVALPEVYEVAAGEKFSVVVSGPGTAVNYTGVANVTFSDTPTTHETGITAGTMPLTYPANTIANYYFVDFGTVPTGPVAQAVTAPFIGSTAEIFAPTTAQAQTLATPFIASTSQVYALGVASEQSVSTPFIASGEAIYAPTMAVASGGGSTTGTELDSITPPSTSSAAGLAWDGTNLWHSNTGTDLIYRLDPADGTVLQSFAAPSNWSVDLAWDGTNLWVAEQSANLIYKLNPADGSVITSFDTSGLGNYPNGLTWDGTHLRVLIYSTDTVHRLDPATGASVDSFTVATTSGGITWADGNVWVLTGAASAGSVDTVTLSRVDATGVIESFSAPDDSRRMTFDGTDFRVVVTPPTGGDRIARVAGPAAVASQALTTPFIASASQVYAPGVAREQAVASAFIASAGIVYAPTVATSDGSQTIAAPFIASAGAIYAPTVAPVQVVTSSFIASDASLYAPMVEVVAPRDLLTPFITSAEEIFELTVGATIFKVWDGTVYVTGQGRIWTGSEWALVKAKRRYDGSTWAKV